MGIHLKPKLGEMFGHYEVISDEVYQIKDKNRDHYRGHIKVKCTLCGTEHLIRSDILKSKSATKCRACSNKEKFLQNVKDKKIDHKGYSTGHQGTGDVCKTFILHVKYSAKKRNIEFSENDMTSEYLWNLFLEQNKLCALSGIELNLLKEDGSLILTKSRNLDYSGWNASLDRIDSSKGYVKGNVQWVDRKINIIKNVYSNEDFIKLCKIVVNHNENK